MSRFFVMTEAYAVIGRSLAFGLRMYTFSNADLSSSFPLLGSKFSATIACLQTKEADHAGLQLTVRVRISYVSYYN